MKKLLPILFCLSLSACNNSKKMTENNTAFQNASGFDKQGHRGCRGLMPENTIPAMLNALGMGVTTLEMDVVITKDRKVILSHEPFFNHEITTRPDGSFIDEKEEKDFNIYKMNYEEVQRYDVGMKPHPRFLQQQKIKATKPLLSDVFEEIKKDMMTRRRPFPFYNIETKTTDSTDDLFHPKPAEFVELLVKIINDHQMNDFVIIQSFDFRTMQYLHKNYPSIRTAMLIDEYDKRSLEEQINSLGFIPSIYSPAYALVDERLIHKCHEKNIKIIPWTVNDEKEISRLKTLGVDGIISDYPDRP